jgi:type IV pilus assembly protein PilX
MSSNLKHRQQGAVLIVALIFLVILTMLGVTAMTGTTMEHRMAGNSKDLGVALQAAETALRDARRDINGLTLNGGTGRNPAMHISQFGDGTGTNNGSCNATGLCRPQAYTAAVNAVMPTAPAVSMTGAPSVAYRTYTGAQLIQGVAQQPTYIIEIFCLPQFGQSIGSSQCKFYRITARGYGGNPNSQVTLQELFLSV